MKRIKIALSFILAFLPVSAWSAPGDPATRVRAALTDLETVSKVPFSLSEYQYQRAIFSYFTDDRQTLSEVGADLLKGQGNEKDRVRLFLLLSDIDRLYSREYPLPNFATATDNGPYIAKLLDLTYKRRRYEEVLEISRGLGDKGMARYFEGVGLLRLNRLKEAAASLFLVQPGDGFYPYAKISLAQIEIMRQNLPDAEKHLAELLSKGGIKDGPVMDKVRILLGQLSFEKGSFAAAIEHFSKVSTGYVGREALTGRAWSLIKLGNYEQAVSLLKGVQLSLHYDPSEWEIQIMLGYCYLKTTKGTKAIDHYQDLLNTYVLTEDRLDQMIKDEGVIKRYRSILLKEASLPLTEEEEHYLPTLQKDPVISGLLREYEQLRVLKAAFLKKDREAELTATEIEDKVKMGETMLGDMDRLVVRPKGVLTATNTVIEQRYKMPFFNVSLFTARIFNHWRQVLKKEPSAETKWLVDLILQEFMEEDTLKCLDIPILCHLVSFFGDQKVKETPEQVREIVEVLDILAKDLKRVSRGQKIQFEAIAARIREKNSSINKAQAALKGLSGVREGVRKSLAEIDGGADRCLSGLDRRIAERFTKARYELTDFREGIIAGLSLAVDVK